jgi:ketosteroid isomerase-like protein
VSANLDLVRSLAPFGELGEVLHLQPAEWAHPEIEWVIADGPTAGRWSGVAGMTESFQNMLSAWDDLRYYVDEYREIDDERVLVLFHRTGRGKASGIEVGAFDTGGAAIFHVREGKVTKVVNYYDRDRALADLGLTPQAEPPREP